LDSGTAALAVADTVAAMATAQTCLVSFISLSSYSGFTTWGRLSITALWWFSGHGATD